MLTLLRFDDDEPTTLARLEGVLAVLGAQPGFRWGGVTRSPDQPSQWLLATLWRDVGSMRRGLGGTEAKLALGPFQAISAPGSGAFEILAEIDSSGSARQVGSDRAADADTTVLDQ